MSRRNFFTAEEKCFLRKLVAKHQRVLENKKTDYVSIGKKRAAWEEIATQFNAIPTHSQRNAAQLRKLWENIKSRRKADLVQEKREGMRTGAGTCQSVVAEDPELDAMSVDIVLRGALDGDTLAGSTEYIFGMDDQLIPLAHDPNEPSYVDKASHSQAVDCPPPARPPDFTDPGPSRCPTSLPGTSKGPSPRAAHQGGRHVINNEAASLTSTPLGQDSHPKTRSEEVSRMRRNLVLIEHDTELHRVRMEEAHFRREEARKRVAETDLRMEETQLRMKETQLRMKEIHKKVTEADLRMEEIQIRLQREKIMLRVAQAKFGEDV